MASDFTENPKFTIKEYSEEEYAADMEKLLDEKGLKDAVKIYLDMIGEEVSGTGYITHMTVCEFLNDIIYLLEVWENKHE